MINLRTPISYYGGKQMMRGHILPLIPKHYSYTEVFMGGGAIFWAKEPVKVETINDLNGNVVNFYEVLKSDYNALKKALSTTLHSRMVYKKAMVIYELPQLFTPLQRAWAFWVACNMGHNSQPDSFAVDHHGKCAGKTQIKIAEFLDHYTERLKHVTVKCNDANYILQQRDSEDAFHYVDPPYVGACQGHYQGYTQQHFEQLLDTLSKLKGKFLLSSYPNEQLTEFVKRFGWHQRQIQMPLCAGKAKDKKKIEVLTANYAI